MNDITGNESGTVMSAKEHGIMEGFPPPPDRRITKNNWDNPPFNRWSFQNIKSVHRTRPVRRGEGPVFEFDETQQDIWSLKVKRQDNSMATVQDIINESYTDGFIVLHDGKIIAEQYQNDMSPGSLHLAQSVSKSLIGTLAGILVHRGELDLDAAVEKYVPELAQCGYKGASIQQVLNMQSGVEFIEEYTDPDSHMALLDIASDWREDARGDRPSTIYDLILTLEKNRKHGAYFEYRSIETDIISWAMQRVSGQHITELLSKEIWSKMGVEQDACFTIDRAGSALVDGGFNACLRDFARFAQMHLQDGHFNDQQIIPADWIKSCRSGDVAAFKHTMDGRFADYPDASYQNQWWVLDAKAGIYQANGVFGQNIHIDCSTNMVAVKLSTWPEFLNPAYSGDLRAAYRVIAGYLRNTG